MLLAADRVIFDKAAARVLGIGRRLISEIGSTMFCGLSKLIYNRFHKLEWKNYEETISLDFTAYHREFNALCG